MNINSVRNKFENLREIIDRNFDTLCVAETKIDSSFPTSWFSLERCHSSYRLDVSNRRGGLNLFIPTRQLKYKIKYKTFKYLRLIQ